ncbi:MAG: FecR domain-containing protein [Spongiibacteraceae bacterium]|jgi:transmembrane sensor|nr:FecR domain-containing protein [Spongiibacteraceae bacterium]
MNTKESSSHLAREVTAEACAWIAQLETGAMTAGDLAALKEWMNRSPAHRAEIRRLARLSQQLNSLSVLAEPLARAHREERRRRATMQKGWRWPVIGAALATVLVFCGVLLNTLFMQGGDAPMLIATEVGEVRETTLPDGSVIKLNTDTAVEVAFDTRYRRVRLLKGEALFIVAHNQSRPFVVDAHGRSVTAVGTAFALTLLPRAFEVLVTEGRVSLTDAWNDQRTKGRASAESTADGLLLKAGQQVTYRDTERSPVTTVSQREIERRLAWQAGFIEFANAPLQRVIEDIGRYTPLTIEIVDPELRSVEFGGIFRVNDLTSLFHALETSFDVEVEYLDERHIRLSRRATVQSLDEPVVR